jgi:phage N-6-adenine-methyltransferase
MTPRSVVDVLEREEFTFILDVCASKQSAKAPAWYDEDEDAFKQEWALDVEASVRQRGISPVLPAAWCNPPYGRYLGKGVGDWIAKGLEESRKGLTIVYLLPCNKQDQTWWHKLVEPFAEVRPVLGRIHFLDPLTGKRPVKWSEKREAFVQDGNSQGSVFVIFGPNYKPIAPRRTFDARGLS